MRKKATRKLYPGRNKFIKQARKTNNLHEFTGRTGEVQYLNMRKHLFYGKPYKRWEHQMEMFRLLKRAQEERQKAQEENQSQET